MKRKQIAAITLLAVSALVVSQLVASPVPVGDIGQSQSWTLVFEDNFDGTTVDLKKWRPNWLAGVDNAITNPVNTLEQSCYIPSNVKVANGELNISSAFNADSNCKIRGGAVAKYSSGIVESNRKFDFTYGYVEFKAWMPAGEGVWPALWTDGSGLNWPTTGEIDVVECYGTDASCSAHYHYTGGGPGKTIPVAGSISGWHTYAVNWQAGRIDWYYDGDLVHTQTQGVISVPHFLIINLGVKGTNPTVPATLRVDYVRVWKAENVIIPATQTNTAVKTPTKTLLPQTPTTLTPSATVTESPSVAPVCFEDAKVRICYWTK